MKKLIVFIYAVLAGIAIAIGGTVFLVCENKYLGAAMFSVGLYAVCTLGLNLYTGKVCYLFDNKPSYLVDLGIIWVGNLVGSLLMGTLVRNTRLTAAIAAAETAAATKLGDGLLSIFLLAILCNFMIYLAVENYKNNPHEFAKYLGIFMGVAVFVMSGFEHCVANMFYITVAGAWSGKAVLYVIVMTLGNSVGGVIFPLARKLKDKYN